MFSFDFLLLFLRDSIFYSNLEIRMIFNWELLQATLQIFKIDISSRIFYFGQINGWLEMVAI